MEHGYGYSFGNGEPPEMSRLYNNNLKETVSKYREGNASTLSEMEFAKEICYSAFGLGSSAYPKFAAFGQHLDASFDMLGFHRVLPFEAGDELKDQRGSFKKWLKKLFITSLKVLEVDAPLSYLQSLSAKKSYKWKRTNTKQSQTLNETLSKFHGQIVQDFTLRKRSHLHNESKEPKTLQADFTFDNSEVSYEPGDHLSIFPRNEDIKVEYIKSRMINNPPSDKLVTLQVENDGSFENAEDLPLCMMFFYFTFLISTKSLPKNCLMFLQLMLVRKKRKKFSVSLLMMISVIKNG